MKDKETFDSDTFEMEFGPGDGLIAFFEAERFELVAQCADILAKCIKAGQEVQETTWQLMDVVSTLLTLGSDLAHLTGGVYAHTPPDLDGCAGCLEDLTSQSTEAARNLIGVAAQLLARAT